MRTLPVWMLSAVLLLVGCQSNPIARQPQPEPPTLDEVSARYQSGDYEGAYHQAVEVQRVTGGDSADQAAYLAGMSAWRLGDRAAAARQLERATRAQDDALRADVNASLGLVYSELERFDLASERLLAAAPYLSGQDQANAYYYAGVALQKIDRRPQARTTLLLARAASSDPAFRARVDDQLAVTGYTLQFGAYANPGNAQLRADELFSVVTEMGVGEPRLVGAVNHQGDAVTLVQAGAFHSYRSAQQARERVGDASVFIVQLGRR